VDAISVELAGAKVREVSVPHHVRALRKRNARERALGARGFEQAQIDAGGVSGEDGEVHAQAGPGGSERIWLTWPDSQALRRRGQECCPSSVSARRSMGTDNRVRERVQWASRINGRAYHAHGEG
jgi:hypothetical protein